MIFETPTESPPAGSVKRRGNGIAGAGLYAFPGKGKGQGVFVVDDLGRVGRESSRAHRFL